MTTRAPGGGRKPQPTKYTPDRVERILQAVRVGATQRLAALYGGVDEDTIIRWRKTHVEFAEAIKAAEGAAGVGWLAKIEAAANDGTWQAAAWKLERRYPHEFGRQALEVTGRDGGAIEVDITVVRQRIESRLAGIAARYRALELGSDDDADNSSDGSVGVRLDMVGQTKSATADE